MQKSYTYQRKDGGTTDCYGSIVAGSNFAITCQDESKDGTWTDNEVFTRWEQVCHYLENNYNSKIEEIVVC